MYPDPEFKILNDSIDPTDETVASIDPPVPLSLSIITVGGMSVLYPLPIVLTTTSSIPLY